MPEHKIATDGHAPVWLYRVFACTTGAPWVQFSGFNPTTAAAFHSADVPYWLGTLDTYNLIRTTRDWTPVDLRLEAEMSGALVAFARTGNPNSAAIQLPRFDPADPKLTEFGDTVRMESLNVEGMRFLLAHPLSPAPSTIPGAQRPIY